MIKQAKKKIKIQSKVNHEEKIQQIKQEDQEPLRPIPQLFDLPQLQQYFQKKKLQIPSSLIQLTKEVYENKKLNLITRDIKKGKIDIKQISQDINEFIKQKQEQQVDKALQLKMKREQMIHQLKYLQSQTSGRPKLQKNDELPQDFKHPNILSKQEHENLMNKLQKEKQQRELRLKSKLIEQENKIKQQEQKKKQKEQRKKQRAIQKKRKLIQENIEKKKQMRQKAQQQKQILRKEYLQIKKKKLLHQKIQQRYQSQNVIPALQEKKKRLRQIRQISQAFNLDSIKRHQKQYVMNRNSSLPAKSRSKDEFNYNAPAKSQKMAKFLQEQKTQLRKKMEERKRKNEQQKSRKDQYANYMRQNFAPKIDKKKRQQIQLRIQQLHKKNQKSVDKKALGIKYLQEAKRKKKNQSRVVQSQRDNNRDNIIEDIDLIKKKSNTNYLQEKKKVDHNKVRRQRVQKIINSVDNDSDKIRNLQSQSLKLTQQFKRKQLFMKYNGNDVEMQQDAVEILLSGIKAKMGIMDVINQKLQIPQQQEQQLSHTQN